MTPPPPKHPSGTEPIDRAALFRELAERGEVEPCPACGVGHVAPKIAARVRLALPLPSDSPTLDEIIVDEEPPE